MYETIENTLRNRFYNNAEVKKQIRDMENAVQRGELTPFMAAGRLLEIYKRNDN
jgi:LAO/AO transport system kinase